MLCEVCNLVVYYWRYVCTNYMFCLVEDPPGRGICWYLGTNDLFQLSVLFGVIAACHSLLYGREDLRACGIHFMEGPFDLVAPAIWSLLDMALCFVLLGGRYVSFSYMVTP